MGKMALLKVALVLGIRAVVGAALVTAALGLFESPWLSHAVWFPLSYMGAIGLLVSHALLAGLNFLIAFRNQVRTAFPPLARPLPKEWLWLGIPALVVPVGGLCATAIALMQFAWYWEAAKPLPLPHHVADPARSRGISEPDATPPPQRPDTRSYRHLAGGFLLLCDTLLGLGAAVWAVLRLFPYSRPPPLQDAEAIRKLDEQQAAAEKGNDTPDPEHK